MNKIPERITDLRVYRDGTNTLLGVADVTLPPLQSLTETVSGAGIAGEYESPTVGQYQSAKLSMTWRTITEEQIKLAAPQSHRLDMRGVVQVYDAANGKYKQVGVRIVVQGPPTNNELGRLGKNATSDGTTEIEALYLKVQYDGKTKIEIDKLNYVCVIDGVDYLKETRKILGV
ncbi:phage major tail tube protein [Brevibacillus composti]|uniref:Phage major tail tube protein n=1 Tax=Brevibacillus composti TaxID=2796470 RepID=A0A7T5JQ37_9BACL|nr:phage major tail tube protein [Brevibacillus composti]QQE75721.1 phage major tail tube protein [Brevibacillus composti]QUO42747.1 phage major tail tube protein [Brevibacillus composti]